MWRKWDQHHHRIETSAVLNFLSACFNLFVLSIHDVLYCQYMMSCVREKNQFLVAFLVFGWVSSCPWRLENILSVVSESNCENLDQPHMDKEMHNPTRKNKILVGKVFLSKSLTILSMELTPCIVLYSFNCSNRTFQTSLCQLPTVKAFMAGKIIGN